MLILNLVLAVVLLAFGFAIFFFFFSLDRKETKDQEQTIAPHSLLGIAFVHSSRAAPEGYLQRKIKLDTNKIHEDAFRFILE